MCKQVDAAAVGAVVLCTSRTPVSALSLGGAANGVGTISTEFW
jgi:hypothetical protein